MDVDPDGVVAVTVAGAVWVPPLTVSETEAGIRLGRRDVPWILDQLLTEHDDRSLRVVLHDGGRDFTDIVTRDHLASLTPRPEPNATSAAPVEPVGNALSRRPGRADRARPGWFEAGGYTPGEQIAVAVVVARVRADADGAAGFTLPAALRAMVGDLLVIGEESRQITVDQAAHAPAGLHVLSTTLNAPASLGPATAPGGGTNSPHPGFRRPAGGPDFQGGLR
ncbi:hypothetical protein [Myceligenerans crystallogenes]